MSFDQSTKYTKEHEWARREGGLIIIGITDYAQSELGDIVFLELPEVGQTYQQNDIFGVVESVKAVSDLFMPMSGEVVEANTDLMDTPETINDDPYGQGWMLKLSPSNPSEWDDLMTTADYEPFVS